VDYGRLSARTVVTGSDGRATVVYTAPPAPPLGSEPGYCAPAPFNQVLAGPCIRVSATPIGSNFETVSGQSVTIHLVPQGVILPPSETPVAAFTFTPAAPFPGQTVLFDGSTSCVGPDSCGSTAGLSFSWSFGDGAGGSGQTVNHAYTQGGPYAVTLTVTNARGRSASVTRTITVGNSALPSGTITVSPTPVVGGVTTANLTANVTAGAGRTIAASYRWNFGDGSPEVTTAVPTTQHQWPVGAASYTITVTVADDIGQVGIVSRTLTVQ
jgi:PKD repeat protein